MARIARVGAASQGEQPNDIWHTAREAAAWLMFAACAALLLYGAWLAFYMHLSKSMPQDAVLRFLACAVLEAALFVVCVRIEPLPLRRRKRKNVVPPTTRQIWQTAPGDFVESIFAAIGIMATPTMLFIGIGSFVDFDDFPDLMITTFLVVCAFGIQGALVSWRGRNMFDPPGKAQVPQRPEPPSKDRDSDGLEIVDSGDSSTGRKGDSSGESGADSSGDSSGD